MSYPHEEDNWEQFFEHARTSYGGYLRRRYNLLRDRAEELNKAIGDEENISVKEELAQNKGQIQELKTVAEYIGFTLDEDEESAEQAEQDKTDTLNDNLGVKTSRL